MDSGYLTKVEHNEYAKRMEDEHKRQNYRITELERVAEQNNRLLVSIEKITLSVENMQKELKAHGKRVEILESRDGEKWRSTTMTVITTIIGIVLGALLTAALKVIGI